MKVTAVFDIGKTNKKLFLFDKKHREVFRTECRFAEQKDEDGFPCDHLTGIQTWMQEALHSLLRNKKYRIRAVNFSTYGASFVHIDKTGKPITPLYNYLKPIPENLLTSFYKKYGSCLKFARETASPPLGMLNSGLQLYWLKQTRPKVFASIRWSLHLPQYMSYLFTGLPFSEFTSIGCHTGLWDFAKNDYHYWVYAEQFDRILPPIANAAPSINTAFSGRNLKIGIGIHDSSAALLPYIRAEKKPFLLLSTGTWSIALNPFSKELLSKADLENDCLNYMRIDGKPIKAARLFLGHEYEVQVKKLHKHFRQKKNTHKRIRFDKKLYKILRRRDARYFAFEVLSTPWQQPAESKLNKFNNFKEAYHQLMLELVALQKIAAKRAMGSTQIKKIYVDGGFADNAVYLQMLSREFTGLKIKNRQLSAGSALGAAIVIS